MKVLGEKRMKPYANFTRINLPKYYINQIKWCWISQVTKFVLDIIGYKEKNFYIKAIQHIMPCLYPDYNFYGHILNIQELCINWLFQCLIKRFYFFYKIVFSLFCCTNNCYGIRVKYFYFQC